jgi:hypothetical protein
MSQPKPRAVQKLKDVLKGPASTSLRADDAEYEQGATLVQQAAAEARAFDPEGAAKLDSIAERVAVDARGAYAAVGGVLGSEGYRRLGRDLRRALGHPAWKADGRAPKACCAACASGKTCTATCGKGRVSKARLRELLAWLVEEVPDECPTKAAATVALDDELTSGATLLGLLAQLGEEAPDVCPTKAEAIRVGEMAPEPTCAHCHGSHDFRDCDVLQREQARLDRARGPDDWRKAPGVAALRGRTFKVEPARGAPLPDRITYQKLVSAYPELSAEQRALVRLLEPGEHERFRIRAPGWIGPVDVFVLRLT